MSRAVFIRKFTLHTKTASFPRKREPSGVRHTIATFPKTLDPRFRGDDKMEDIGVIN
jgi:hypothetical protein